MNKRCTIRKCNGRQIFDRVYLLEDAHQQESATCDAIADDLLETDAIVADRHHCIVAFMNQIANKGSSFIIRQPGRLPALHRECLSPWMTSTGNKAFLMEQKSS